MPILAFCGGHHLVAKAFAARDGLPEPVEQRHEDTDGRALLDAFFKLARAY